jgi:hypothetical protein
MGPRMIGCSIPRSFNKTLLFIKLIFALAAAGVLAAQDTSASVSGEVDPFESDVQLTLQTPPYTIFSVRTANHGKFRLSVLPAGTYTLTAEFRGCPTLTLKSIQVGTSEQKRLPSIHFEACHSGCGGAPAPKFFELHPTGQHVGNLSGRVMRDERRPIARATVKLLCDDKPCGQTRTDANGEFIFFNLSPSDNYKIRVTHPGFYPSELSDYEVQEDIDAAYWPLTLEHCPRGNCDPKLRPKRPLVSCD